MVDKIVSWVLMGLLVMAWYYVGSQVAYFAPEEGMSMGGLGAGWWFWTIATIAYMRS